MRPTKGGKKKKRAKSLNLRGWKKLGPEKKGEKLKLWFCVLSCQAKPTNVVSIRSQGSGIC